MTPSEDRVKIVACLSASWVLIAFVLGGARYYESKRRFDILERMQATSHETSEILKKKHHRGVADVD